ncbi:ester cyclase [Sinomonas mesophila]|uniref:ester cyclase n=1 Tax=Sinomonas mesophila TaxID=1531955 RepID=UPI0009845520|nr:SgcJ/EcaC family oxidoreductase [Sinomonas mesophila]
MTTSTEGTGADAAGRTSLEQLVRDQLSAFNSHDATGFTAFYADDAVVVDPQYPEPLRGRAAIEEDVAAFFTAMPDLRATVTNVLTAGESVAAEMDVTGTQTGPLALPDGELPATGRRIDQKFASFSRVDAQGRIAEEHRYYDLAAIQAQLGQE